MPPKSLTTFWIGSGDEGWAWEPLSERPMLEYHFPSGVAGATPTTNQPLTEQPAQFTDLPRTGQAIDDASRPIPHNVVLRPRVPTAAKVSGPHLQVSQLWEGTVIDVRDDQFAATLTDKTGPSNPDEQAVFECAEVSQDDRNLISPGSVFYWTIGTRHTPAGRLENISMIEFRRSPAWTERSLADAENRTSRIKDLFQPEL
jgi:hypothetical protein